MTGAQLGDAAQFHLGEYRLFLANLDEDKAVVVVAHSANEKIAGPTRRLPAVSRGAASGSGQKNGDAPARTKTACPPPAGRTADL